VLRHLTSGEKTIGELAALLSRRNSSVGETLKKLRAMNLVSFQPAKDDKRIGRGNPSGWWSLTDSGRVEVEDTPGPPGEQHPSDDEGPTGPWELNPYQAFVRTTLLSREIPALLDVLTYGEQAVESSFVARLDGDAHDYVFIFDPQLGARPAEMLVSALNAAELPCVTGVIGDVRGLDAMVRDARAANGAAQSIRRRLSSGNSP
jgi:hypothetical protein